MSVIEGGTSAALAGVGVQTASAIHLAAKPSPADVGHFRTSHRTTLANTQAANSRLFSMRNLHATNLLIIHKMRVEWLQTGAHTAAILDSLDLYKCTSYSATDTANTVTPTISKMRTSMTTIVDGTDIAIRGVTVAGAAAGMTGGTMTKDGAATRQWGQFLLAAAPTGGTVMPIIGMYEPDAADGEYPMVLVQNEGIVIENRVLLGAAAASAVSIDVEFSMASAY